MHFRTLVYYILRDKDDLSAGFINVPQKTGQISGEKFGLKNALENS